MLKALILDADGVIINGIRFSQRLKVDYGLTIEDTAAFFQGKFQECLVGKADLKKELPQHLKEWGWNKSVEEFLEYWFKSEHQLNQELINYLSSIKNKIKCYVATNQEKYRTEYIIDKMGFNQIFDKVFSSAYIGHKKPQKEFYEYFLKNIGDINKEEIIFWDNSKEHISSAQKVGLKAELYKNFNDFKTKMQMYI